MNPKIIAVDFDGCLVTNKYPEVGEPIEKNIARLKEEQKAGAKVILWTNRRDERLSDAIAFCHKHDISLDAVNENLPEIIEEFGGDTRKIFANEYWDDRAVLMDENGEGDEWAIDEVRLACEKEREDSTEEGEWEYGVACYQSALRAYQSLCRDRHSGYSIQITKSILNRLVDGKCLTPIEDTPDIWAEIKLDEKDQKKHYQCKRMSSLFKDISTDGTVTYTDVNRVYCVDVNSPDIAYTNRHTTCLVDKFFPITMPYLPSSKKYKVVLEDFLVDPKMGDYDTVAYLWIEMPNGKKVELNRYFKETENGLVSIEKEEYEDRKSRKVEKK